MDKLPLLSVCMITYGHENYIIQAIESVLMQKIEFNYEFVIANDCSPDKTDAIVKKLISSHKKVHVIKYIKHNKNIGMYANFIYALNVCQGKYIALCEGDDFWTDPLKLQKQVGFLETHPDYEVCFTNISIVGSQGGILNKNLISDNRKTTYVKKDLPIWAPTLTRVFRNRDFNTLPSAPGLDTVMLLWQSQFGAIKFINEITGSYRKHDGGIYSAQPEVKRKEQIILTDIVSLELIDKVLYSKYFGILLKKLVEVRYLDEVLFKKNKVYINQAFNDYRGKMSWSLNLKISISFLLVSLPFINRNKKTQALLLKILNHLFLYVRS